MQGMWGTILHNGVRAGLARARIWFRRFKTRRRLHELDARELDDIGQPNASVNASVRNGFGGLKQIFG